MKGTFKGLIVALDVDSLEKAEDFVDRLYPTVRLFKIGSQLFTACGPQAVEMIGAKGAKVFLDLKFHDIPYTVFRSVSASTGLSCEHLIMEKKDFPEIAKGALAYPVFMMTVHTQGGRAMLKEAVRGASEKAEELRIDKPYIIGVTRLTSDNKDRNIGREILEASRLARDAGLDGVVCAALEASLIRKECGPDFLIVTPGIRPKGYPADDQSRIATAEEAIRAGADYIVVGRPILTATDPLKAVQELI